jgi:hypothetical protein
MFLVMKWIHEVGTSDRRNSVRILKMKRRADRELTLTICSLDWLSTLRNGTFRLRCPRDLRKWVPNLR